MQRTVFFISDGTGITAEALGHSLISQFDDIHFTQKTLPYIDKPEKAQKAVAEINAAFATDKQPPLLFSTLIDKTLSAIIATSRGLLFDFFETFLTPMETALAQPASRTVGRSHGLQDYDTYKDRIDAINLTLATDDGSNPHQYEKADVILAGVSRSGKTPTCLYLALQFGIRAANYPFTEEDLEDGFLPKCLRAYQKKMFGLTINPEHLQSIRQQRRPDSHYASIAVCRQEVLSLEALFRSENIPFINTTTRSIEEIATKILARTSLQR